MTLSGTLKIGVLGVMFTACGGNADRMTERTASGPESIPNSNTMVGNRDAQAKVQTHASSVEDDRPGEINLYFSTIKSDPTPSILDGLSLKRGSFSYELQQIVGQENQEWQKACPSDCVIETLNKGKIAVMVAASKNTGHDSFLIGIKVNNQKATNVDEFRPDHVIEVVCRGCSNLDFKEAQVSKCANIRSMWASGSDCVAFSGGE